MQEINLTGVLSIGGDLAVIESKTITENGTYNPPSGVDGYAPVVVNVPASEPVIESKTITENGTYNPPSGVDGYAPVFVNVSTGDLVTSIAMNKSVFNEGGATITYNENSIDTLWNGFSNIGCSIVFLIPFRNKNKIIVDIALYGENYQHSNNISTRNFNTSIGVTDIALNTYVNLDNLETNNHLLADVEFNGITNYNLSDIHREIDISELTNQDLYLFIQIPGVTLTNLSVRIV